MKKYIYLASAIVIIYFFQSFFNATGGVGADSLSYFGIASDFPRLETNLFPVGFPLILRLFYTFFHDYFWAGKILNILLVIFILSFSYYRKFFFRETVLLFTGKTLFFAMNYVVSEGPFLFMLYFLIYFFHERFTGKLRSGIFVFFTSLLLIFLFTIRYSGIYLYLSVGIFWVIIFIRNKSFPFLKDIFLSLLFSGIGIAIYLCFNHFIYGSFTGENLRGAPEGYHAVSVIRDLLGITNVIDPFIGIKPSSNSFLSLGFQFFLMAFDLLVLWYFLKLYQKKKQYLQVEFHFLLLVIAFFYSISLLVSGYFQQIEEINVRMLAAANFCLFFSVLIIYFKELKSDKSIFNLGCFFLVFLTVYSLKTPADYFQNRKQIEAQLSNFTNKKFLFNDEKGGEASLTIYKIPLINRTFSYKHTNNQKGDIKHSIVGTLNPQIKWIKYDTVKVKSKVLYSSEIKLK